MFKIGPNPCGRQPRPDCFDCQDCPGQSPLSAQERADLAAQANAGVLMSEDIILLHKNGILSEEDMKDLSQLCWE